VAEDNVTGEVPGASAGVSSQASAKHQEFSTEVKSSLKRKSSDPNPEREPPAETRKIKILKYTKKR